MNIPGYQDLSPVARGGFASVYRARQVAFDREVAVKVLTVEIGDGKDRRRFERECVLTGRLTGHPAIVTILDSGFTDHGLPYLTTPFYHAGSLVEQLRRDGSFTVAETLRIGVAVAGALELAHRNGILHRDVKPGNILLSAYGEPALTDFGIAALVQANGATSTQLTQAFTVDHAPPEVLEGDKATVCADVYSLGSTLWMLLSGRAPFAGGDPGILPRALRVRNDPLPPIGRTDVPASLVTALTMAMAKDPQDRFDTAAAFGDALQRIQRELGEPVTPLRADAPLRTSPPRPATDDPEATQALSLAALDAFGDGPSAPDAPPLRAREPQPASPPQAVIPGLVSPFAPERVDQSAGQPAIVPVAASARPAPPGPAPLPAGAPRPRWRGAESGWYDATQSRRAPGAHEAIDAGRASPAAGSPDAGLQIAADRNGGASPQGARPRTQGDRAHPHDRYGSGAADGIAVVATPASRPPINGSDPWQRLPSHRRRLVVLGVLGTLIAIAILAALLTRRNGGDTTITTPNPGERVTTTAPPTTATPTTVPVTTELPPPTTAKPVPATAAPTTAPPTTTPTTAATTAPTTAGPATPRTAEPGTPVLPGNASPEVRAAAGVAQRAGDALANGDWETVRSLIPSLTNSDDEELAEGWGRLDAVTMVVTDSSERRGVVVLRVGEVAHERNTDDSRRTSLYCATWTVEDGRVVAMAGQQTIAPSPWRTGWADPADAVDQLRKQCRDL